MNDHVQIFWQHRRVIYGQITQHTQALYKVKYIC